MQPSEEDQHVAGISPNTGSSITANNFSRASKITCFVLIVLTVVSTAFASPLAASTLPVLIAPTIWFFWYHSTLPSNTWGNSERMFWIYLATALIGMPVIIVAQAILLMPIASLLFGAEKDFLWHELEKVKQESDIVDDAHRHARAAFAARPSYWAFIFCLSFVTASGLEELLKYIVVLIGKRDRKINDMEYIVLGATAALSFATFENIGFLVQAGQTGTGGRVVLTLFERMVLGIPLHLLAGTLTAAGVALRDKGNARFGFLRIIGASIFFHGLFDFVLLGYSAWSGQVGWIHPEDLGGMAFLLISIVTIILTAAHMLRKRMAMLVEA